MSKSRGIYKKAVVKPDPWANVTLERGKLKGGILTDDMMKAVFPTNDMKYVGGGLDIVRVRVQGQRTPIRSSPR